jgi:hypothetical protein
MAATRASGAAHLVPVADLYLDPRNPRLVAHSGSQKELLAVLWRDFAVHEVAISIAANGYWEYEPLLVTRESGRLYVVEGNRRLAAVKLLLDEAERVRVGATDLPEVANSRRDELVNLPVLERPRDQVWQYIGFKHVNGPQAWQSYSKAQYIGWVHNELRIPLEDIADTIGDAHDTVLRLYRALMILEQAEREQLWNREDRYKSHFSFSHLSTGVNSYSGIQKYLGLAGPPADVPNPVGKKYLPQLQELMIWLFGSRSQQIPPVVQSQNPHLRQLDRVLQSGNAVAAMRGGMTLDVALDVAKGDAAKLRENLVAARRLLQDSRGKILTGFGGEPELLALADEILALAEAIADDMRGMQRKTRRATRTSGRASQ